MTRDAINTANLIQGISSDRLQPYRLQSGTEQDALKLYKHNILLSEALYPSLHMLEVVLRNNLERVLIQEFGPTWYQLSRFTYLLVRENGQLTVEGKQLRRAINELAKARKPLVSGRVVAELNFSFWTRLLGRSYENYIWRPYNRIIFPDARASDREIRQIRDDLTSIRFLRNRVAHHEPIWNDPQLQSKHAAITRLLSWLNADAATYLGRCDRFSEVHKRVGVGSNHRDLN